MNQECLSTFQELKTGKKIKFIIYGMNADNTEIVVLSTSTEKSYDTFLENLPETECRWAVYDMEFDSGEGIRNKLCFYMWSVHDSVPFESGVKGRRRSGRCVGVGSASERPSPKRLVRRDSQRSSLSSETTPTRVASPCCR